MKGLGFCSRVARAVLVASIASACSQAVPPPLPSTFDRPGRVAFMCIDTNAQDVLNHPERWFRPLSDCQTNPPLVQGPQAPVATGYSLHALLTQTSRGEVAAVNLTGMKVVDSRADIPGYTFVPAGDIPVAIANAPNHPMVTYVANSGSRDISVLKSQAMLGLIPGSDFRKQVPVLVQPSPKLPAQSPFDMVLSPDEDALFVSAPNGGWLLRIPIRRCADGSTSCPEDGELDTKHMVSLPVGDSLAKARAEKLPAQEATDEAYQFVCSGTQTLPVVPADSPVLPDNLAASDAQPAGLAIDAFCKPGECPRRLLVADQRLPLIHVFDLDALAAGKTHDAVLDPIITGAPTQRVAVTPKVPVTISDSADATQYVYAIDARDGSVLVAQNDRLISVNPDPAQRADRIDLGQSRATGTPVALSLALLTPNFDTQGPADQWVANSTDYTMQTCTDPTYPTLRADRLRGVFLAVGLTDGTVRIVNVHDMALLNCRVGAANAGDPSHGISCQQSDPAYDPYPVVRNRLRIDVTYVAPSTGPLAPVLAPTITPQYQLGTDIVPVKDDGTTNDPRVAGLDCVTCSADMAPSFPTTNQLVVGADGGLMLSPAAPSDTTGATGASGASAPVTDLTCNAGAARVCALADPWVDPDSWAAIFEGEVPGARGGDGRFVEPNDPDNQTGSLEFVAEAHFCDHGVIGDQDKNPGDQLEITSPLPPTPTAAMNGESPQTAARDWAACVALVADRDLNNEPIAFKISRAYDDRLVISPQLVSVPPDVKSSSKIDYAFVRDTCFQNMRLTFAVHARDSYIVSSGTAGFTHNVMRGADNRCTIDAAQDPRRVGRAYENEVFDNGFISFKTRPGAPPPLTQLNLLAASDAPKLIFDATAASTGVLYGVLPVDLEYSFVDQRMYMVDISVRGLTPIPLAPMPTAIELTGSYQ